MPDDGIVVGTAPILSATAVELPLNSSPCDGSATTR
jgi:hypothetical protein